MYAFKLFRPSIHKDKIIRIKRVFVRVGQKLNHLDYILDAIIKSKADIILHETISQQVL